MSAETLRDAAKVLRERAEAATPAPWLPFDRGIGVRVKGCTCAGPIPGYPQHESWCGTDGPIIDGTEPDIAYVAMVHPGVGLALAEWLDTMASMPPDFESVGQYHAFAVARAILGGDA